ncbi:adenylate/guanylate cyclase domain-containing protein [Mycolicibacterium goodii]|uniref:LuxR family transcriptional regulator n=1 Tax=Mycolicibacterium goodii TaxID=134601 RepID=A0A0K0X458_MYCGD|nr:LuxR family transcriptional regulator [Mycolicibacterium goodii]
MTEKLSTETKTLLMARVDGAEELWQTELYQTIAAIPWLRASMAHLTALNDGTVLNDASDSFVVSFDRAWDAVMCALDLQLAPLEPFALCIGVHTAPVDTGDTVDSVDTGGVARLRDLAHGGQTLISAAVAALASDRLPAHAALTPLRYRVWPEPLYQLDHPGLRTQSTPDTPITPDAQHLSSTQ